MILENAEIPTSVLKYMGLDKVVIGTVTNEPQKGAERPRCKRFYKTGSVVNWMDYPNDGSKAIAQRLMDYGKHRVSLTINFMPTLGKKGDELLNDLERTINDMREVPALSESSER